MPYPFLFKPLNLLKYFKVQMQLHQIGAKHLKVNGSRSILVQVSEIHKPYGQIFVGLVWHQHQKYWQYTDSFRRQWWWLRP